MPIYEYQCLECKTINTANQKIHHTPFIEYYCENCKEVVSVKRLISNTSFILKGKGWEKDGYK